MGFDLEEGKTLLYSDLFKLHENQGKSRNPSSSNSSSSGFTTPFGSDLASSESSDDGDFAAELSRQMAEFMLHEEEEEERNSATEFNSNESILDHANRAPSIKLKNQFPIGDGGVWRGRRVKGSESTQYMKTEQNRGRYREWRGGAGRRRGNSGSGMQAVFLGGPGSRNGPSGTGVFLPRGSNDSVELKKKSGLSTVLIPTRVLEALELHFKRHSDSEGSPRHASYRDEWKGQGNAHTKIQMEAVDERQILPQEWTY